MTRHILIFLLIFIIVSCKNNERKNEYIRPIFHLPFIIQTCEKDSIELRNIDSLNETKFIFFGKYCFADTLNISDKYERDSIIKKDLIREDSLFINYNNYSTEGFQIFADYPTTIKFRQINLTKSHFYYPVYAVNETPRTKTFVIKDGNVFGIQEAIDTSENLWRPIECKEYDFCGNGYLGIKVKPGEFVMFLVPKYEGHESCKLRLRLRIGENIYISKEFMGSFNYNQFLIKKETAIFRILELGKRSTIQTYFYGAIPKGY